LHMKTRQALPLFAALAALAALLFCAEEARRGAYAGLLLCARVIVPSLFPFFVLATLLTRLGFAEYIGVIASPVMSRLFNVSGEGAAAFVLGVSGGYPLGAATVAELYAASRVKKEEAERLLAFCDNSGPAFIVGAAGVGVFHSAAAGLLLYLTHVLSAAMVGGLVSFFGERRALPARRKPIHFRAVSLPESFAGGVRGAAATLVGICGFVVFFSALVSVLDGLGLFGSLAGALSVRFGTELHSMRALLTGFWELGSGIGSLEGLRATPGNLALAAFILGWGGLSVQCQALGVLAGTDLSSRWHWAGKVLHAVLSAVLTYAVLSFLP